MSMRSDLQYYFEQRPNAKVWRLDLMKELELTDQQVVQSMYHVASLPGYEILERGQCWVYRPALDGDAASDPTLTVVKELDDGRLLATGEGGKLYVAKELKV